MIRATDPALIRFMLVLGGEFSFSLSDPDLARSTRFFASSRTNKLKLLLSEVYKAQGSCDPHFNQIRRQPDYKFAVHS